MPSTLSAFTPLAPVACGLQNKKKMSLEDFARINRSTNEGEPMPRELLEGIYASIARDELKISSGGRRCLRRGWRSRRRAEPTMMICRKPVQHALEFKPKQASMHATAAGVTTKLLASGALPPLVGPTLQRTPLTSRPLGRPAAQSLPPTSCPPSSGTSWPWRRAARAAR